MILDELVRGDVATSAVIDVQGGLLNHDSWTGSTGAATEHGALPARSSRRREPVRRHDDVRPPREDLLEQHAMHLGIQIRAEIR